MKLATIILCIILNSCNGQTIQQKDIRKNIDSGNLFILISDSLTVGKFIYTELQEQTNNDIIVTNNRVKKELIKKINEQLRNTDYVVQKGNNDFTFNVFNHNLSLLFKTENGKINFIEKKQLKVPIDAPKME